MENVYMVSLKKIEETGKLSLKQRKEIWKDFENSSLEDEISAQEKRFQLALSCVKKAANELRENTPLYAMKEDIYTFINILEKDQDYDEIFDEIHTYCDEEVEATENFVVAYFRQAMDHMLDIKVDDEALLEPRFASEINDAYLEVDDTDTSYGICNVLKYQDESASMEKRGKLEKDFWRWYVQKAANIQGIEANDIFSASDETIEVDDDGIEEREQEVLVTSLAEFVEKIDYNFRFIEAKKEKDTIILEVKVLDNKNKCPKCGQEMVRQEEAWLGMNFGKLEGWKIRIEMCQYLYHCDNASCTMEAFFPAGLDYSDRKANFTHITSNSKNRKKLSELFKNI